MPRSLTQPGVILPIISEALRGNLLLEDTVYYGQQCELRKGIWGLSDHDLKPVIVKFIRLRPPIDDLGFDRDQAPGVEQELLKRMLREVSIWVTLNHVNILPLYGYQIRNEELLLVSRRSEKQSIGRFLTSHPELTIIDKLELLHEAACGLEYLHSRSPPIVHGGIQPRNVIITDDLHAVLSDVALSRVMVDLGIRTGLTPNGQAVELAGYQAEELFLDESLLTPLSDVYAFGGLILSTLSGKEPFWNTNNPAAIVVAITRGSQPQPGDHPQLPPQDRMWDTMRRCWSSKPDKRPHMTEVKEEAAVRISEYDVSWNSAAPKRARDNILITTEFRAATGNVASIRRFPAVGGSMNSFDEIASHQDCDREPHESTYHNVDFVQQLGCLNTESIPATREIVDALLALAGDISKVTRNKHKLYRALFLARDICVELHRMPKRGHEASDWIEVLDDLTETLDFLTQVVTDIVQIVKQEMVPFELSSLLSWNQSCATIMSITEELTKDALRLHLVFDAFEAKKDGCFDDISWLAQIFHEGILAIIERTYISEHGIPTEAKRFVDILDDLQNEVKLLDVLDESARGVVIRIFSDVASVAIQRFSETAPEFWRAASDTLQVIKPLHDLAQTLSQDWNRFYDIWIAPGVPNLVVAQAPQEPPLAISTFQDLIHLQHKPTPATEQAVALFRKIGNTVATVRRHKHKVYSIVLRIRDIFNYILSIGERPENQQETDAEGLLRALDDYDTFIDRLERELKNFSEILLKEKAENDPASYSTWSQSRAAIIDIQNALNREPFNAIPSKSSQDVTQDSFFDDCFWLSLLLHDNVEPAIARQFSHPEAVPESALQVKQTLNYIENEIKQGRHEV
ncbi:hypothetical protein FRC01_010054 [Tulasnella sp. 417]|nr:hypothetical protein FRC01_010054 [Tulasnella sp. 417]